MYQKTFLLLLLMICSTVNLIKQSYGCPVFMVGEEMGRTRRSLALQLRAEETEIERTGALREYFTACMETLLPVTRYPQYDWESTVEFTILDSQWNINTKNVYCSAAGGGSTKECWQKSIRRYLTANNTRVLYGALKCIAYYAEDMGADPPTNRYVNYRGKRSSNLPRNSMENSYTTSNDSYSDCLSLKMNAFAYRKKMDFNKLSTFIQSNAEDSCDSVQSSNSNSFPTWPYKFVALSRLDSPLRTPLKDCGIRFFPPDPYWSTWSGWSVCEPKCGSSKQFRRRVCHDGSDPREVSNECPGRSLHKRSCPVVTGPQCTTPQPDACPRRVNYTQWTDWSKCMTNCTQNRRRLTSCGLKKKKNLVVLLETRPCRGELCTISASYSWGSWSNYRACSASCNGGIQTRNRDCIMDAKSVVSSDFCRHISGSFAERRLCNRLPCDTLYAWGLWSPYTVCRAGNGQCGDGIQSKTRVCLRNDKTNGLESRARSRCRGRSVLTRSCRVTCPAADNQRST